MIRARSLAQVVNIADNPPLHHQSAALPEINDPLILYIARVPGSRDVFLTTIKPLDKVVRAEDVNSCLYYVHLDCNIDSNNLGEENVRLDQAHNNFIHGRLEVGDKVSSIRRKPLPLQLSLAHGDSCAPTERVHDSRMHQPLAVLGPQGCHKFQEVSSHGYGSKENRDPSQSPNRKLLGPRPRHGRAKTCIPPALPPRHDLHSVMHASIWERSYSTAGHDPCKEKQQNSDELYAANCSKLPLQEPMDLSTSNGTSTLSAQPERSSLPVEASLTLIRRYGGAQLNVASIKTGGLLEMLTSGYSKYYASDPSKDSKSAGDHSVSDGTVPFRRMLRSRSQMSRPQYIQKLGPAEPSISIFTARRNFDNRRRSQSISDESANGEDARELPTSRRYTFDDPWDAQCEFAAGIANRSLKCKRSSQHSNPASLSELRFNLPSSQALRSPAQNPRPGTLQESKRSSFLARHYRRPSQSFSEESISNPASQLVPENVNESRLDLSLAQEHAGGGFGGKQAKLGKLVIEPQGTLMLDLLVAANVAMWWRIYEKSS